MTPFDVVSAAIPLCDTETAELILWARTPFPCAPVSARTLYKAASSYYRARGRGYYLCDFCERLVGREYHTCDRCEAVLRKFNALDT
jgi:hypothetical protein